MFASDNFAENCNLINLICLAIDGQENVIYTLLPSLMKLAPYKILKPHAMLNFLSMKSPSKIWLLHCSFDIHNPMSLITIHSVFGQSL